MAMHCRMLRPSVQLAGEARGGALRVADSPSSADEANQAPPMAIARGSGVSTCGDGGVCGDGRLRQVTCRSLRGQRCGLRPNHIVSDRT